jgi:hypothetical protein
MDAEPLDVRHRTLYGPTPDKNIVLVNAYRVLGSSAAAVTERIEEIR